MFLSTRNYDYFYKFIVSASKISCESLLKEKLPFLLFKKSLFPSLNYIFFLIRIIFSGKIFKENRDQIIFNGIEIGRFALAKTYADFECYLNQFKFYKVLIKNFLHIGILISSCVQYYNKYNIRGVYIDHCGYLNGVLYSFFAQKKLLIYTNNYPLGIYFVNFKKRKKIYSINHESFLKISLKKKINNLQKKKCLGQLSNMTKNKRFIPWLKKANFKSLDNLDYQTYDYVIYTQSFVDGQMWYGYDGFENSMQWLKFTLDEFIGTTKKILIKPHPNFYNNSNGELATWDRSIYLEIVKKYEKNQNFVFLKKPIHNYILLKKLRKDCVIISQHGSVILETSYMNFKSISSTCNFFDKKFKISNVWDNKKKYSMLLKRKYQNLHSPNRDHLLELIYALFYFYHSEYHKNFYVNIIKRKLGLSKKMYEKKFFHKARTKVSNAKKIKFNKYVKLKENIIINEIADTIWQVKN